MKFKFSCGCIRPDFIKHLNENKSTIRYCPEHLDGPAIAKVFTCARCNVDFECSMRTGGQPKYCISCGIDHQRDMARARSRTRVRTKHWRENASKAAGWRTDDEIHKIENLTTCQAKRYYYSLLQRNRWDGLDKAEITKAAREKAGVIHDGLFRKQMAEQLKFELRMRRAGA